MPGCEKTFSRKFDKNRHEKNSCKFSPSDKNIDSSDKGFVCAECGVRLRRRDYLSEHFKSLKCTAARKRNRAASASESDESGLRKISKTSEASSDNSQVSLTILASHVTNLI